MNVTEIMGNILKKLENQNVFSKWYIQRELNKLSDQQIIDEIGMAEMSKIIYILQIKYNKKVELIPIANDLMLRIGNTNVANMSYLAVQVHFLTFDNGRLTIEGTTSYPTCIPITGFIANINGHKTKLECMDIKQDLMIGTHTYEKRQYFKLNIELKHNTMITFENRIMGIDIAYGKINSMRFSPVADILANQFYEKSGWVFFVQDNHIVCRKSNPLITARYETDFLRSVSESYPEKLYKIKELRSFYYEFNSSAHKRVWLFMDRADKADDNARVLFEYVQKYDEIDSYFILSSDSLDYSEIKAIGKIVALYSMDHLKLSLIAECMISSQCNGVVENPFWDDCEFYRDLYHRPKMIFLQHGIIKDDMSPTLNRFHTNFAGFVTSTKDEYNSIFDYPYFYTKKEVWLTGLPRYDRLCDESQYNTLKKKYILVMPSWRKELMEQKWDDSAHNMKWVLKNKMKDSAFFKRYSMLLRNRKLQNLMHKKEYEIIFCLHPLMREYAEDFFNIPNVIVETGSRSYNKLFALASILITDYSSVAFDFAYLKKPIIYYQFDEKNFYREHSYKKGYFDYRKDGFGPVVNHPSEAIRMVDHFIKNNCVVDKKYLRRIEGVYEYDRDYCRRVYKKIIEITKSEDNLYENEK